jgi:hypothetical protein
VWVERVYFELGYDVAQQVPNAMGGHMPDAAAAAQV